MNKTDSMEKKTPQNVISLSKFEMSFLLLAQDESNWHFNSLKFIHE